MGPYGQAMRNPFGQPGSGGQIPNAGGLQVPGGSFVPQRPGGFGIPQVGPVGQPGDSSGGVFGGVMDWINQNPMGAYLGASAIGGAADYFERRGERNENKRRYEEAIERDRKHREAMGRSLGAAWGG